MKAKIIHTNDIKGLDEIKDLWPEISLVTEKRLLTPKVKYNPWHKANWLDFDWLRSLFTEILDIRCLAFTHQQLEQAGITTHLGMYDVVDSDKVYDFYLGVPGKLDDRARKNGFKTNLAWLFLHELMHGKEKDNGGPDRTHIMEEQGRLKELIIYHRKRDDLKKKVGLLQTIFDLTKKLLKLKAASKYVHPVPKPYKITQPYGVSDPLYKSTGHHIGTDYSLPVGTALYAPCDGEVIKSNFHKDLGNFLEFKHENYVLRLAHLDRISEIRQYKQGDILAVSGNTGLSSGPHVHVDVFINKVDLSGINSENFKKRTIDPEILYNS